MSANDARSFENVTPFSLSSIWNLKFSSSITSPFLSREISFSTSSPPKRIGLRFSPFQSGLCSSGGAQRAAAEAVSPGNRGPGLGIFYTWYYVGMTAGPALAGWTRDISGSPAAPVILGAAMLICVVLLVGTLRILQVCRPIEAARPSAQSAD